MNLISTWRNKAILFFCLHLSLTTLQSVRLFHFRACSQFRWVHFVRCNSVEVLFLNYFQNNAIFQLLFSLVKLEKLRFSQMPNFRGIKSGNIPIFYCKRILNGWGFVSNSFISEKVHTKQKQFDLWSLIFIFILYNSFVLLVGFSLLHWRSSSY